MSYRLRRLKYAFQDNPRQGVLIILMILAALVAGWWFVLRDTSPSLEAPEVTFAEKGSADGVVSFYASRAGEKGLTLGRGGTRATLVVPATCLSCAPLYAMDLPTIITSLAKRGKMTVAVSPVVSDEADARIIAAAAEQGRGTATLARMAIEGLPAREAAASVPGMDMAKLDAALESPSVTRRAKGMVQAKGPSQPTLILRQGTRVTPVGYPFSAQSLQQILAQQRR